MDWAKETGGLISGKHQSVLFNGIVGDAAFDGNRPGAIGRANVGLHEGLKEHRECSLFRGNGRFAHADSKTREFEDGHQLGFVCYPASIVDCRNPLGNNIKHCGPYSSYNDRHNRTMTGLARSGIGKRIYARAIRVRDPDFVICLCEAGLERRSARHHIRRTSIGTANILPSASPLFEQG
nr:hypothetical protein CFP56_32387 [Quercus suber]